MSADNSAFVKTEGLPHRFFSWVTNYPKSIALLSIIAIVSIVANLQYLYKDTRADAFLSDDNPALVYRNKIKDLFGLADPIVVAVVNEGEQGIFNPESLDLINRITKEVKKLPNVDPERVRSLATEKNITGTDDGMDVEDFYDPFPDTQIRANAIRDAIRDFPLYQGSMVANDEKATLIIVEMLNEDLAEATYEHILDLVDHIQKRESDQLFVAGEGAIAGYLGSYIDSDAQRLNPIAGLVITIIFIIAFRKFLPALLANVIIAASVLMTLSTMAGFEVPFYVITNALPVILIGIAVADSLHVFSHYFELQAKFPEQNKRDLTIEALVEMWRPITLTTFTTIAGFLGLYFAAYMPPFKFFGAFTALGVAVAWIYSLLFLPAAMVIVKPKVSKYFIKIAQQGREDIFTTLMVHVGRIALAKPKATIFIGFSIAALGVFAATHLVVNEDRIETFHPSERIYKADKAINGRFDGTNNLDIVIETTNTEDLFYPENLRKIEALQTFAETLPYVQGSTSIVDYLKQMNRSLNEGQKSAYVLPEDKDLVAQYFLLYTASSEPDDFEEEVDYDYRIANVRLNLNSGSYVDTWPVIEALDDYIETEFNNEGISAIVSGRVNVNYHWIKDLGESHFKGLFIALILVWAMSSLLFGSMVAGFYSLLPVVFSILLVYSAMVSLGINLGIGTSMFASVAIGLGVDFAIHTVDKIKNGMKITGDLDQALLDLFPSTGRALFFNFVAIGAGFGTLISSQVVPLNKFGTIVSLSVTTSFLTSMTLLPALVKVFKPKFIMNHNDTTPTENSSSYAKPLVISLLILSSFFFFQSTPTQAAELPDGRWIVDQINNVDEGLHVTRKLKMHLTDKRGKTRIRDTIGYRKYFDKEKRSVLFYLDPSNVKGTGFLTYDYPKKEVDDDQWLYLPALRKVRRISASDRGDYFLGTDMSYEDIKKEGKIEVSDYHFKTLGQAEINGTPTYHVEGVPVNEETAEELGYGRTEFWVSTTSWVIIQAKYWDTAQNPLKTLIAEDVRQVDGIWTRHVLKLENHKTQHKTTFEFSEVDYQAQVDDSVFTKRRLSRGR